MLTKNDLKQIEDLIRPFVAQLQESQDDLKEDLEKKITQFKSDILDAVDAVMGEIKKSREEQTTISGQLSSHSDELENHEERIGNLERKTAPSAPPV